MRPDRITELIGKCAKCGACRNVCPLLEIDQMETSVARGKIEIIRRDLQGELPAREAHIRSFLDNCLLCGRCETRCPNQVKTVEIISNARAGHTGYMDMVLGKKALVKALSLPSSAVKAGSFLGKGVLEFLGEKIPSNSGIYYRLPSLIARGDRMVPEIPARSFLESAGESIEGLAEGEADLLFTGCVYNYLYPQILTKTAETLARGVPGEKVSAPVEQSCCGLPAMAAGDLEGARHTAEKNINLFLRARGGKILFPCGSCLYMVKKVYSDLFRDTPLYERSLEVASRCQDYESYLVDMAAQRLTPSPMVEGKVVSYHRPCHLSSIPNATENAELLLSRVLKGQFKPMMGADRCCGFGGTFNMTYFDKSRDMGISKIKLAEESGTDIIATSCSGCIHHLRESAVRSKSRVAVVHTGEVFDF